MTAAAKGVQDVSRREGEGSSSRRLGRSSDEEVQVAVSPVSPVAE